MGYGDWQHLILPAVSIAFMSLAINARLLRASMLEVSSQRHVVWARLRGERAPGGAAAYPAQRHPAGGDRHGHAHWRADRRHHDYRKYLCLAGVGRYAVSAIFNRDYPVIQCFTLMMVTVFVLANLAVDVLNAALDPRLRRHEEVSV